MTSDALTAAVDRVFSSTSTIAVTSQPEQGSVFTLRLPVDANVPAAATPPSQVAPDAWDSSKAPLTA